MSQEVFNVVGEAYKFLLGLRLRLQLKLASEGKPIINKLAFSEPLRHRAQPPQGRLPRHQELAGHGGLPLPGLLLTGAVRRRRGVGWPVFFSSPAWDSVTYWSLDIETGGLDPRRDPIIALGMLPIRAGIIRLGEAYRTLVRPEDGREIRPESVRAHQLVRGEVREAPPLPEVLGEVDRRVREGALLVHHQGDRRGLPQAGLRAPRPRAGRRRRWWTPSS